MKHARDDLDVPRIAGRVQCPECEEAIPVALGPLTLDVDEDGQQVATVQVETDDVWAHAWAHEEKP